MKQSEESRNNKEIIFFFFKSESRSKSEREDILLRKVQKREKVKGGNMRGDTDI